jgi:hypothetical protein
LKVKEDKKYLSLAVLVITVICGCGSAIPTPTPTPTPVSPAEDVACNGNSTCKSIYDACKVSTPSDVRNCVLKQLNPHVWPVSDEPTPNPTPTPPAP